MKRFLVVGLLVTLVLAFVVSRWASSSPDGLERVAEDHGFAAEADDHAFADLPTADYAPAWSGLLGVGATLGVTGGVLWLVRRQRG